jgi:hypothetical protein
MFVSTLNLSPPPRANTDSGRFRLPHDCPQAPERRQVLRVIHFLTLRRVLESHPEDVVQLLDALAGLPAQERKMLVDLLQRTTLSNIIRAAKLVDDRLHFLRGLEAMLSDKDLRGAFLERDHLHEMLAKNTWMFGDAYALTVSDESLTEVVKSHVEAAGLPIVVDEQVLQSDGRRGRVDLMLTRAGFSGALT